MAQEQDVQRQERSGRYTLPDACLTRPYAAQNQNHLIQGSNDVVKRIEY